MNDILSKIAVSLLVRLRVEIKNEEELLTSIYVSLLVRLRVEITKKIQNLIEKLSASS